MEDQPKVINIVGLSSSGTLKPDAGPKEIDKLFDHLGSLSTKADIAMVMAASEIACNEHVDPIVSDMCARVVGLTIFSSAIVNFISSEPLLDDGYEVTKAIAKNVREEMILLENACNGIVGLSKKGKIAFQKSVTEFLIQTFSVNLPGVTVGVCELIKRHG